MGFLFQPNPFNRFSSAEPLIEFASVEQVFQLNLIKRAAFTRLDVIFLVDSPEFALLFNQVTDARFKCGDFHGGSPSGA